MKRKITLTTESEPIKHLLNNDDKFIILYSQIGELSYRLDTDYYGFMIQTIIGQMLSSKVADILTDRLIAMCGTGKIDVESVKKLKFNKLLSIGLSRAKAQCIIDFTKYYSHNEYTQKRLSKLSDDEIIKEITSIKGLGMWSAKMFLMFALGKENILPYEDSAYQQAFLWYHEIISLPSKPEIIRLCDKWSPYNSAAARYLYQALDNGLTKKPFTSWETQNLSGE